jgi:hypothetical protein
VKFGYLGVIAAKRNNPMTKDVTLQEAIEALLTDLEKVNHGDNERKDDPDHHLAHAEVELAIAFKPSDIAGEKGRWLVETSNDTSVNREPKHRAKLSIDFRNSRSGVGGVMIGGEIVGRDAYLVRNDDWTPPPPPPPKR